MEYVYAALMLHKLKKEITEENVTSIVKASGTEVNEAKVKSLVASLADVNTVSYTHLTLPTNREV